MHTERSGIDRVFRGSPFVGDTTLAAPSKFFQFAASVYKRSLTTGSSWMRGIFSISSQLYWFCRPSSSLSLFVVVVLHHGADRQRQRRSRRRCVFAAAIIIKRKISVVVVVGLETHHLILQVVRRSVATGPGFGECHVLTEFVGHKKVQ